MSIRPVSYTHLDVYKRQAENFLAAIIYFFVNFHPVGFKNGKKLKRYVSLAPDSEVVIPEGNKLELVIRNWDCLLYTSIENKYPMKSFRKTLQESRLKTHHLIRS